MKALIDCDVLAYSHGSATDDEFKPLKWPLVQARVDAHINAIMDATGADDKVLFLTSDDKSNFRYDIATIRPYKGQRKAEKPHWYNRIRQFLEERRGAVVVSGMEADDAMSIMQYEAPEKTTIICTVDKDLAMVPGYHYSWSDKGKKKGVWFQDEIGGLRCFYKQLLTGDTIDNIPGLFGVGNSSALLKHVDTLDSERDMYEHVYEQYEKRFGSYAEQFLIENGRLLWMLKSKNQMWNPPQKVKNSSSENG